MNLEARERSEKMYLSILKKDLKRKKGNEYDSSIIYHPCHNVCIVKCKQHYKCYHSTGQLFLKWRMYQII